MGRGNRLSCLPTLLTALLDRRTLIGQLYQAQAMTRCLPLFSRGRAATHLYQQMTKTKHQ